MAALLRLGWVEIKLLLREPITLIFSLVLPLIVLLVLGGVFGDTPTVGPLGMMYRGLGPMSYYVPAYLVLVAAAVTIISLPTHLAGYRERGVLKRYRAAGVSATTLAGAQLIMALVLGTASSAILLVGASIAYDFKTPTSVPAVVGTLLAVTVAFTAFGFLLGALLPTARAAQALGLLAWFVMLMLGGAGPPREVLGTAMQRVSDLTPLWYGIRAVHHAWFGLDPGPSWIVLGALAVVSAVLGLALFRWE